MLLLRKYYNLFHFVANFIAKTASHIHINLSEKSIKSENPHLIKRTTE